MAAFKIGGVLLACVPLVWAPCPGGTQESSDGHCSPCDLGHFRSDKDPPVCRECPEGKYAGHLGHTACSSCPAGTFSTERGIISKQECVSCSSGRWSNQSGATSADTCLECPAGKWGREAGATSNEACAGCAPGKWSSKSGGGSCTDCPSGRWSAGVNLTTESQCIACASGKWSTQAGATSSSACEDCSPETWASCTAATQIATTTTVAAVVPTPARTEPATTTTTTGTIVTTTEGGFVGHVKFAVENLDYILLTEEENAKVSAAFAEDLAKICHVAVQAVKDMDGHPEIVSLSRGSVIVDSLIEFPTGKIPSLTDDDFNGTAMKSVLPALGGTSHPAVKGSELVISKLLVETWTNEAPAPAEKGQPTRMIMAYVVGVAVTIFVAIAVALCLRKQPSKGSGVKERRSHRRSQEPDTQGGGETEEVKPLLPLHKQTPPTSPPQSPPTESLMTPPPAANAAAPWFTPPPWMETANMFGVMGVPSQASYSPVAVADPLSPTHQHLPRGPSFVLQQQPQTLPLGSRPSVPGSSSFHYTPQQPLGSVSALPTITGSAPYQPPLGSQPLGSQPFLQQGMRMSFPAAQNH